MTDQIQAPPLDAATVRQLCGDVSDAAVLEILRTGASLADVEAALAWLVDGDAAIAGRPPLTGPAAGVLEALEAESPDTEEP